MGILGVLLLILFVLVALLLVAIVLIQDEGGEGLGGLFGGGSSSMGVTTSSVLVRATTFLGALFLLTSLGMAFVLKTPGDDNVLSEARQLAGEEGEWWTQEAAADESAGSALEIPEAGE